MRTLSCSFTADTVVEKNCSTEEISKYHEDLVCHYCST